MDSSQSFGLAHLWAQSDSIIRAVALILLLMSIMGIDLTAVAVRIWENDIAWTSYRLALGTRHA